MHNFIMKLLSKLEQFPEIAPLNTFAFIPKNLGKRYAVQCISITNYGAA